MKIILIFFIFHSLYASSNLPFYFELEDKSNLIKVGYSYSDVTADYERDEIAIDQIQIKGNIAEIDFTRRNKSGYEFNISFSYLVGGDFKEKYRKELSFIPTNESTPNGFKEPILGVRKWLAFSGKGFKHAAEITYRPKLFDPKISSFSEGRHIGTARYLFSYINKKFELAGEFYARLYGKRELRLNNNTIDETEPYTEAGFIVNPGVIFNRISFHCRLGYSSTTDYNTSNRLYKRESDKGFIWHYGFNSKYQINQKNYIELSAIRKETSFNSIEDSPSENIEFQIQENLISAKWGILF